MFRKDVAMSIQLTPQQQQALTRVSNLLLAF